MGPDNLFSARGGVGLWFPSPPSHLRNGLERFDRDAGGVGGGGGEPLFKLGGLARMFSDAWGRSSKQNLLKLDDFVLLLAVVLAQKNSSCLNQSIADSSKILIDRKRTFPFTYYCSSTSLND